MRNSRLLAATLTATASLASATLLAAPAHATLTSASLTAITQISKDSSCTTSTTGGTSSSAFSDDGNPVTQSQASAGSVVNGSDVTQVSAAGKGTVKVTRSGGSLSSVDYTATASAKAVPSSPSTVCNASAVGYSEAVFGFSVAHPGWLNVSSTGSSSGSVFDVIQISGPSLTGYIYGSGTRVVGKNQIYVPAAGSYTMVLEYGASAAAKSTSTPQRSSLAMKMHLAYTVAGGASGAAAGAGNAYVHLAGARNCGANNVSASFTGQASKVKTASFYVNGALKKTVHSPSGGTSVLLGGLSDTSGANVKAVLKLKSGRSATVTRSYVACS